MKNRHILFSLIFGLTLLLTVVLSSCRQQNPKPASDTPNLKTTYSYLQVNDDGKNRNITELIKDGSKESISDNSVVLGRVLFYDKKLSVNNTISCGSCHHQATAFADNVAFSTGFGNLKTTRNSMSILNPVSNNNMFWDSRASSPLELSLMPVFNHLEMGMENDEMLVTKLQQVSYYPELFTKAFGDSKVTKERISIAVTQFLNCLFSKESKFDKGQLNNFANYTPIELFGKELFFSPEFKCAECHDGKNFSAPDFPGGAYGGGGNNGGGVGNNPNDPRGTANIGLDLVYTDNGRGNGKFKIPSLRNIEFTAPYMHDGRFKTLEEVLNHYSHGIQKHHDLDDKLKVNGKPVHFNFSENEKVALISFLRTLSDYNLITNPKFSDPFKQQ